MKKLSIFAALMTAAFPLITTANDNQAPTFAKDIAPIFFENCVDCHRPGEIAPMSLIDYKDARPWAKSIKQTVVSGEMPPWHPDNTEVAYRNDRSLSKDEIASIVKWVDAGSPLGDPSDMPEAPTFVEGWGMGEPNLIFHATEDHVIGANASDREIGYKSIIFDTSALTEDLYIQAWELRPSASGVVHHANLALSPTPFVLDGSGDVISQAAKPGGDYIGSFLPGSRPMVYPEGTAYLLPKGSHLALQIHYVGKDEEVTNHMMFGVKFAQGRIDKRIRIVGLVGVDKDIDIKPNQSDYVLAAEVPVLFDLNILSSGAHMHLRGWEYKQSVTMKDGSEKLITHVPRYDFNWQSNYWLANPVLAPKGSSVRTIAYYNNSAENPNVDDPNARVTRGSWTEDEMLNSWSHAVIADENLGLKLEDGRVVGKFDDAQKRPHPMLLQGLIAKRLSASGEFIETEMINGLKSNELERK